MNYQGKTALITGASSGIGAAFAEILAQKGMNLVLVSRSAPKLEAFATQLQQKYQIQAEAIAADLSQENIASSIYQITQKRKIQIDMLINNAGFSTNGNFASIASEKDHQQVMLNVIALVDLTHAFLPDMLTKGEGIIINLGSATSFFPLPYQVVYGASKAFILSFSEALWAEYRQQGIKVLALCPGPTNTNFFKNANSSMKCNRF
jgi:short-subunit dehydrogenase